MATFDEFYASLDPDVGIRGGQFEKFVKWFLKTDPTWASQVDEVWLWNEYPKRWGADCGIDLVFTHKNGTTWAVQSKCISPNNDIKKSEIDSFLSESNDSKIDGRLLIASTDGIGKNAQQVIHRQEKQVVCFFLEQFRQSEIEFPSSMEDLNLGKRKVKKTPRPHQIQAIEKVSEGLKIADRGQVLMACGTGKTLTSLWIKEKIKAEQVLILVPSLSLLSQTLKEWNAEAKEPFKWICVCSDKSVAKDKSEDQWISNSSEIGVPVTSETLEVKNFLDESGSKVVFATYQSVGLIVEAQEHHDTNDFDLVIADEAHRCAGKVSDAFGSVLDERKIKASKRLFFTATPKILSKQIKTMSLDMDFEIASMDDYSVFGEVLYQLKFSEAIERDLLSDYQLVVIGVDDEIIKQKIVNRTLIKVDNGTILDAEIIASQIAIAKAIKDYDLNRIITFHSKIKNAKDFAKTFDQVIKYIENTALTSGSINCEYISGVMKTSERNKKLYELKNLELNERRILSNARCLSEGVDVPTLSGIAFINPKQSQIDIIQAVGRAIRKSGDKSKGIIIIPLYISKEESLDEAILLSNFKKVWQIVIALKSQDDSLMECIDKLRIEKGREGEINIEGSQLDKFIFDIPERISKQFSKSIKTLLVENSSENWYERFGELKEFNRKYGIKTPPDKTSLNFWCKNQRANYKKTLLSKEKVKLLESIGFVWDINEEVWQQSFIDLKIYFKKYGNVDPPYKTPLKEWCSTQRKSFNKNKLSPEKVNLLNNIGFVWDTLNHQWNEKLSQLKNYFEENGKSIPVSHQLSKWVGIQRINFKKNKLSPERIAKLNDIGFIWDVYEESWYKSFSELKEFYRRYGIKNPPDRSSLNNWCKNQRNIFRKGELSSERINLLNEINFVWETLEEDWDTNFQKLKEFFLREGHSCHITKNNSLGTWILTQRAMYSKNKLSEERIKLLKTINFVWDVKEYQWNITFEQLKQFYLKEGHFKVNKDSFLGRWIGTQRKGYKQNKLSQNKVKLLNSINFIWDVNDKQWNDTFLKLKDFYLKEGHSSPPQKYPTLGSWTNVQRREYACERMAKDRIEMLESIEFKWKLKN